jgi:hypothetical protein
MIQRKSLLHGIVGHVVRLQPTARDKLIHPQGMATVTGQWLGDTAHAPCPGKAGKGKFGAQTVAGVVGVLKIGFQEGRTAVGINPKDAVVGTPAERMKRHRATKPGGVH